MTVQAKYIYLARRHPSLDPGGFTQRWRRHGALGMSMPRWANVRRYAHNDTVALAADIPGVRNDYDGVGMIWYRSLAARASHTHDLASQATMEADEAETFSEPVANFGVLCAEQVLRDDTPGNLKLMRFVTRPASVSGPRFDAAWDRHTVAVLQFAVAGGGLRRYVHNRTLPAEGPQGWGLKVDGVEELWFDQHQSLESFCRDVHGGLGVDARDGPWAETISVVTNEVVLYDRP